MPAAETHDQLRVIIAEAEIASRIEELGARITADYPEGTVYLVGILKGAFMFLSDLARAVKRDIFVDFMSISSYGRAQRSSGEVKLVKDLDVSIEGCHVVIVEDIVDTGLTLHYLLQMLAQRHPASLRIAALLDKPDRRVRPINVEYVGFRIPDEFVVGYGLDYAERYRNLPRVCVLERPAS